MKGNARPLGASAPAPAPSPEDGVIFGVVVVSEQGQVLRANTAFLRLLGYSSLHALSGKTFRSDLLKRSSAWQCWADVAAGAAARDVNVELVNATGQTVCMRGRIEPVPRGVTKEPAARAVLVEDSARQHLQELGLRTAQAEGVLGLAAGVSHDFNNLLTVLVGNLYLVSEALREQPPLCEKVRKARDAAKRGAALARQLTALSRGAQAETEAVALDVGRVIDSLTPLLGTVLGSRINLTVEVADDSPPVLGNRSQLESVITNLVINARDALAGRQQGRVTITVRRLEMPGMSAVPELPSGSYTELAVSDDGAGIPSEIRARIFEPFFSTKEPGRGTGLGLPMVRWFAERAGGTVSLESHEGRGTAVRVFLPAHHAEVAETAARTMPLSSLPSGSEAVVVLSDDRDLRSTVEQVLSTLGYRLIPGGLSDLVVSLGHDESAVLIVDGPSVTASVAAQVDMVTRRRGARLATVLVGDSRLEWRLPAVTVPKPFTLHELATAVRAAIEGG